MGNIGIKDKTLNWGAVKVGTVAVALAFSFSMGYQLKDNIDHPKVANAAEVTPPKAPAQ